MKFVIMLDDLKKEVQQDILTAYKARVSEDINFDIAPIAILEIPDNYETLTHLNNRKLKTEDI